ncbi:MAG: hypothetical protein V3V61_00600 [Gammaproteobacteria bacterium]
MPIDIYSPKQPKPTLHHHHDYAPKPCLSLIAIGLLSYLRQWPSGWHIHAHELKQYFPAGSDRIHLSLQQLCRIGAITRLNHTDDDSDHSSYRNCPQHIDIIRHHSLLATACKLLPSTSTTLNNKNQQTTSMATDLSTQTIGNTLTPAQKRLINHAVRNTLIQRPLAITAAKLQAIIETALLDPFIFPQTGNKFFKKLIQLHLGLRQGQWTPVATMNPSPH